MRWKTFLSHPCGELSCVYVTVLLLLTPTISGSDEIPEDFFQGSDFEYQFSPSDNYLKPCEAFFYEYVAAAGNFTHCELLHAKPFRICTKCYEPYAIMSSLYNDLTTDPKLHKCMVKYLKSDRVQIIPTVQRSADDLWKTSACTSCIKDLNVDQKTKEVEYTVPREVHKFLDLYTNISACLTGNISYNYDINLQLSLMSDNISALCKLCDDSYQNLNDHYNAMSNHVKGDVCMDVVDMMNYTRVTWSVDLNCSHRSGDAASVVIITLAVAVTPLFFYLPLRYTSKEKIKTVLKQKRYGGFTSSASASFAKQDSTSATSLPPIGS